MTSTVPDTPLLERFYRDLWRVRRFDERVIELFNEGVVRGTAHSCVGQEAIAVGACAALSESDYGNCSPPAGLLCDQAAGARGLLPARASRIEARAFRPRFRPVATMERMSA